MIYLAMVRVLANVEADSPAEAAQTLAAALDAAGFSPFREGAEADDVSVSEVDVPDKLPRRDFR